MAATWQVLTTSNITEAIDLAFVDRADIKAYIGPPSLRARYEMLASCLTELSRAGILAPSPPLLPWAHLPSVRFDSPLGLPCRWLDVQAPQIEMLLQGTCQGGAPA